MEPILADRTVPQSQQKIFQSLVQLKKDTEEIQAQIISYNEKIAKKKLEESKRLDAEKQEILSKGGNPYEVFRQREQQKLLELEQKRKGAFLETTKQEVRNKVALARNRTEKERNQQAIERRYLDQWKSSKAVHLQEQHMQNTTGSILLSANTIFPSEHVKLSPKPPKQEVLPTSITSNTALDTQPLFIEENNDSRKRPTAASSQHAVAESRQTKKDHPAKKQIVMGREFKGKTLEGAGFIASPEIIEFKDFEVGKSYQLKVQLTNISFSFNSFKLVTLPPKIKDFFKIEYSLPGRMSAGTYCSLKITFMPKLNEDIADALQVLTETGALFVPIVCETKKCKIAVTPTVVQFGNVPLGEIKVISFNIVNTGAIPTNFEVIQEQPSQFELRHAGYVAGYATALVDVSFKSTQLNKVEQRITIKFSERNVEAVMGLLQASAVDILVYTEINSIDLQTCYLHQLYRDVVTLRNRGGTVHHCIFGVQHIIYIPVQIETPLGLESCLEFIPQNGYVQVDSQTQIQIKFRPSDALLEEQRSKYNNDKLSIPVKIRVSDQTLPLYFTLIAKVTTADLVFSRSVIDFKTCPLSESVSTTLEITNPSALPQKFGFVHLRKEMKVEPDDGFGTILPFETLVGQNLISDQSQKLHIIFSPSSATLHKFNLHCQTLFSTYSIACKGEGVKPSIYAAPSLLKLCPTCIDDVSARSIKLVNSSKVDQSFEMIVPDESHLMLHPSTGTIVKGEYIYISVQFRPSGIEGSLETELSKKWKIPCVFRSFEGKGKEEVLFIDVQTWMLPRYFTVLPTTLQFGTVPIGTKMTLSLTVQNVSSQSVVEIIPACLSNWFTVVTAWRSIPAGKALTILIQFMPDREEEYHDTLQLCCRCDGFVSSPTNIPIYGRGVNPTVRIEPVDPIQMGVTLANETIKKTLKVINTSAFEVTYTLQLKRDGEKNYSRINPFSIVPSELSLSAGEEKEVTISFTPDHEHYNYTDTIIVEATNTKEKYLKRIESAACSGSKPIYLIGNRFEEMSKNTEDKFSLPLQIDKQNVRYIHLTFKYNPKKEIPTATIEIGNIKTDKKNTASPPQSEYLFDIPKQALLDGFNLLDAAKGTIVNGQKKSFVFQFTPEDPAVGQRKEAVIKCIVKSSISETGAHSISAIILLTGYT